MDEIEELKKKLYEKDLEIEMLKKQLNAQKLLFDSTKVESLLNEIKPDILKQREYLIKTNKHIKVQNKSLFHRYQDSKLYNFAQQVKKIPIVGNTLVFFKKNILNWD